jgi:hypothetical protein
MSVASFYLASQREIALLRDPEHAPRFQWAALKRLPLVMSMGIGLCVNQTRAVFEALMGRETEFVRTPKHGIRGRLENWSGKKYRAAKSLTPFIELALAAYFVVAIAVALDHRHYISVPFLLLFLCGFGYVGWGSVWQGGFGAAVRARLGMRRRGTAVVPPPAFVVPSQSAEAAAEVLASQSSAKISTVLEA